MTISLNQGPHPLRHGSAGILGSDGGAVTRDRQHERERRERRGQSGASFRQNGTAAGLRLLLGAVALAALAACEPTATGGMVQTASGPVDPAEMVANAPPMGTAPLDLDSAVLAYQSICLDTLPRFAAAEEVVRRQGMAQNPTTGTWYDPRRELSVNLEPSDGRPACSIVFASNDKPQTLSIAVAMATGIESGETPNVFIDFERGGAFTPLANGTEMVFETGIGGRSNLHRVLLVAGR